MNFPLYAFLSGASLWAVVPGAVVLVCILGFTGAPFWLWTLAVAVGLYGLGAPTWLWIAFAVIAAVFNLPPLRRVLSGVILKVLGALNFLPTISQTEKEAIDAGTVWVDGELFSGKPDFRRILEEPYPGLTPEEQAFLDGPVEKACAMTDDWEVFQRKDLPLKTWDYLKQQRFFGMIIPTEYGGLGFSPSANSAVVGKLSSANAVLGISVMVPNSLGPAELLVHYGTDAQKQHYLPRLARGEDIPAFALTEPGAGSDAGAITSRGKVFKGADGRLMIRLNWDKRYITLAAISTVLGMAFKLDDPDNLLGKGEKLGITCALVPTKTPGVTLGMRHDPLGIPFYNCPTRGEDVVLPFEDAVIGGVEGAGKGWRMLMESLAAGRGISLPATSNGGAKRVARVAGAHSVIRKQFGVSIGKFEGIAEPLARIGGFTYILEAARRFTCGGLDSGAKPAVVTALAKYSFTELFRKVINDGMDILGGNAISLGPRNTLGYGYVNTPISITVEGANILTRTLVIFGQGAIRCHPYTLDQIRAAETGDVKLFDRAFWSHVGHVVRNGFRSVLLSLSRGRLAGAPVGGPTAKYYRKLSWASASFAVLADLAMGTLGGELKRKESVTGRFADILTWLYLGSTVLRRFEAEGRRKEDLPFVDWSMRYALTEIQAAFDGLYENLDPPAMGWLFRGPIAAWSRFNPLATAPTDHMGTRVARALQRPGELRDRHTAGVYLPTDPETAIGRLDRAMALCAEAEGVERKLKQAIRARKLAKAPPATLITEALEKSIITVEEASLLRAAEEARDDAIQVDSFSLEEYKRGAFEPETAATA
ncbi:MAG: acyl-CoA dehydrogenase [bacterium]|nr:acyl-CoA dehydrogenase [bacterium]